MTTLEQHVRAALDPLDAAHVPAPAGHRSAGVLLLLDRRDPALPLLFVQRTEHLRHHPGQIAFPGGVAEDGDASVVDTALREAGEEAAVPRHAVEVAGLLPPFMTATSDRWLTPVVGFQSAEIELVAETFEVARLFTLTLEEIATAPHEVREFERNGMRRDVHFYEVRGNVVWGVTAAVIAELLARVAAAGWVPSTETAGAPRTG